MLGERTVMYRAMCEAERAATLAFQRPCFVHRHKFFSADLGFIATRVRDGRFGGYGTAPGAYVRVMAFDFRRVDLALLRRLNAKEWSLSRRDAAFLEAHCTDLDEGELARAMLRLSGRGRGSTFQPRR